MAKLVELKLALESLEGVPEGLPGGEARFWEAQAHR